MKKNRYRRSPQRQKNESSHFFGDKDQQAAQPSDSAAFFQPKLEIDPVNSPAEKEADAVAQQVVHSPRSTSAPDAQAKSVQRMEEEPAAKRIQKQAEEEPAAKRIQKQEEEQAAAKHIQKQAEEEPAAKRIQKQEEEQAAAKHIQKQAEEEPAAKRIQKQEEEQAAAKHIQKQAEEEPAAKRIQKQAEEEPAAKRIQKQEEEQAAAKRIQKKEAKQGSGKGVENMIQQTKGGGSPLPEGVRMEMEQQFGADFSRVRIHTGADAVEMTKALQAHAFTHGYDIYFNEGRFAPESKGGKELLAHELVHVVQQKGSGA